MQFSSASLENSLARTGSVGCWTGLVADMPTIKALSKKTMPECYLEQYPRNRARALNTWLSRFGMYSNGVFFELDRRGSALVKDAIMKSKNERCYVIRVTGVRKDNKIQVHSAVEMVSKTPHTIDMGQQSSELRKQFAVMGI